MPGARRRRPGRLAPCRALLDRRMGYRLRLGMPIDRPNRLVSPEGVFVVRHGVAPFAVGRSLECLRFAASVPWNLASAQASSSRWDEIATACSGSDFMPAGGCPAPPTGAESPPVARQLESPRWIEDAERLDLAIYAAIARTPSPALDVGMSRLSRSRRLLAPLVYLRRAPRACRGTDRPPRCCPGAGFAGGHRGRGQHRGQAARAAATPGPSGGRGPARAPRADAELALFPLRALRRRLCVRYGRRPRLAGGRGPAAQRSPPWSATRASTRACTTRATCWRAR